MVDVFIIYAHEDRPAASRLYSDLKRGGIRPWIDHEDLLPGQDWEHEIRKVIRECRYFLALLSQHSLSKVGFVQSELKAGLKALDEYPLEKIFLIPVRIEECNPSDERIRSLHRLDLFPSYEEGLGKLIKVLKSDGSSPGAGAPRGHSFERQEMYSRFLELINSAYRAAMKHAIFQEGGNPLGRKKVEEAQTELAETNEAIFNLTQKIELLSSENVRALAKAIAARSVLWRVRLSLPDAKTQLAKSQEEYTATERPQFIEAVRRELGSA